MALTLWQPWASLVAVGAKQNETRCWGTSYRGRMAIHAAKNEPEDTARPLFDSARSRGYLNGYEFDDLPRGCVIAIVQLVDCIPTPLQMSYVFRLTKEYEFGNYAPGRFIWKLENIRRLKEPIYISGHQRLWKIEDSELHGRA